MEKYVTVTFDVDADVYEQTANINVFTSVTFNELVKNNRIFKESEG